ncbi:hypothetical protein PMAYCL1PPCAC_06240, partial [Pristionchus mayeri]
QTYHVMSNNIPGRGKQRKHGQDLNSNAMPMGGGQMAMPPNGASAPFATPIISQPHALAAQEYGRPMYGGVEVQHLQQPPVSGSHHPTMVVPNGMNVQQEQTSQYATMQGLPPQNMRGGGNPNMQWQNPQQPQMAMHGGMAPNHVNRGAAQQSRGYPQQPQQMGYYAVPPTQGYAYMQPAMYPQQQYTDQQAYAAAYAQQQQFYPQIMQQQHMMHPQQTGVAPAMTMQAPPALQQQGGGATGGVAASGAPMGGVPTSQQQPMQGGSPSSGVQSMHGGAPVSVPPGMVPQGIFNPAVRASQHQQQQTAPAPIAPKKKNVLLIVDPNTQKAINEDAVEESKREEDAPKAEKEEAKGTDEPDSAAPEVKKQFAAQILEQTTKSDQPAPAPTPAPPVKENKSLFSAELIKKWGLENKVAHTPAPPAPAPAAPVAAAPVAEQTDSEYLPSPLPTPAYPIDYKAKQDKEATPEDTEMPETNNDEQPDDSHLAETTPQIEEPASSSSEKNTSNDSAICVQTPVTPHPPTESRTIVDVEEKKEETAPAAADEPAVEEEEQKEETETEQPAADSEPLIKKLEQLVIAEPASQDEAESEPSTPAPVTPSVSETAATLAEEEEDAEKIAAAIEEEKQRKRAELEAEIAKNEEDIEQVNIELCRYNREYLYNVRDLEKLFSVTPCPLTPEELKNFGICRSLVSEPRKKQDGQGGFMPGWARSGGGGQRGGHDRKPYQGRQSEQHHRGGGRPGSNKKLPPSIRPSIERRVETNVQLHKAEKAWKPEKVTETDESEEAKKKVLLKTIRSLFNKITPTTKDALINEFLDHKVYESPSLSEVISIIFDKAVEEPKFCPLYATICQQQVSEELKLNNNVSNFRNAILVRAQETFTTKNQDDIVKEKEAEIEAETDEKKKKEKKIELLEAQSKFRRRKFGNITFIGQLYLQNLISVRIILFCVYDLLKSVTEKPANLEGYEADEESVDCAVRLLETTGKRLQEEANQANRAAADAKNAPPPKKVIQRGGQPAPQQQQQPQQPRQIFPIEGTFQTLEGATPYVSSRIRFMIMNLVELRKNGWVPRKTADAGPKKLDEIKKDMQKEQMENAQAAAQFDRKHSRQEQGGRGGPMGGGYGGGGANPKRMIIQRNSTDRGTIDDRRSQAHKAANLNSRGQAPAKKNVSLSSVMNDKSTLGGRKESKWGGGASGGSENSKKEERSAAIASTSRFMAGNRSSSAASMKGGEEEGASASGTTTQANSEDEREQNEQREKQEAEIMKRCMGSVGDYAEGEIKLDEARDEILDIVVSEKYSKSSLQTVFKCYMEAAMKKSSNAGFLAKFGHVLAYCLLKKTEEKDSKGKEEILKGVADFFRVVVDEEKWEDMPKIWDFTAEVLINAHLPEDGLFVGAHPTLVDFKDSFLTANKADTCKPYALFVLVLKRLAEMHHNRDKDNYKEIVSWALPECESILKHMDEKKLDEALEKTKMDFAENLHEIMRQH